MLFGPVPNGTLDVDVGYCGLRSEVSVKSIILNSILILGPFCLAHNGVDDYLTLSVLQSIYFEEYLAG